MTAEPPFDRAEAARRLGVTESWLRAHKDEVPHLRIGRRVRFTQDCLDDFLAARRVDPLARSQRSRRRTA